MKRLEDNAAFITGAATGIGRATAQRFAAEGANLYLVDMNEKDLAETAETCRAVGATVHTRRVNVCDEESVREAVVDCLAKLGKLDTVANIAGIVNFSPSHEVTLEEFRRTIDVNLIGTFLVCREAIPALLESKGAIINTASTTAERGAAYQAAYSASKGGVLAMTRSLAVEYARKGLRANCVCPGGIATAMTAPEFRFEPNMRLLTRHMALQKPEFAPPERVASVIAMLASQDGSHINGESIRMDGAALA